ncbi:hypothetical protein CPB84DRAFT_374146 [Gymnopilus junonius]|uniref:F-box domain-containing protein n=1 Tax=Gymnopilus junonius TaxID=109634 RepID=A0A9P5THZ1_GYMJU|nr:hypothetical protein CPB84DRAFT_374146 [Gymnopilus junonius]
MSSRMSISVLANEILLEIFFMNTNIFLENDCLRTTIYCSQVCRSWRSLLLFTPSVWGRLLHVNELRPRNSSTREKILSRSRNSLLWVSGTIYSRQLHGEAQLLRFLLNSILYPNWDRIEHLNLSIHSASEEDLWPIIQLPAPNLRSFHFSGKADHEWHVVFTTDAQPLFSDCAPMLQRFSADCIPFTLSAPWMRHLRKSLWDPSLPFARFSYAFSRCPSLKISFFSTYLWKNRTLMFHFSLPFFHISPKFPSKISTCTTVSYSLIKFIPQTAAP